MKGYQKEQALVKGTIEVLDVGSLVELASEGLLSLSTRVGLEVVRQLLEADVTVQAGPKGTHNPDRTAYRHGTGKTPVVMGGQKARIQRPRVRSKEGVELQLPTLSAFQNEDPLNQVLLSRLLSGVSTRKYARTLDEPVEDAACISKSEASRRFASAMEAQMDEFFKRRIEGSYPAMMLDGLELGKMTIIAAMGIDAEGKKRILGLAEGGSENSEVVKALLNDLIERGFHQWYGGIPSRSMPALLYISWETFSSSVIRETASSARSSIESVESNSLSIFSSLHGAGCDAGDDLLVEQGEYKYRGHGRNGHRRERRHIIGGILTLKRLEPVG